MIKEKPIYGIVHQGNSQETNKGRFVALVKGEVIAIVNWQHHDDDKIEIFGVETMEQYRGMGIMTHLFTHAIQTLAINRRPKLFFLHSCGTNKRAVRLYANAGFKVWKVERFDNGLCYNMEYDLVGGL
jgi:ribosomal protein S18 acetylase RimI-like enzyme